MPQQPSHPDSAAAETDDLPDALRWRVIVLCALVCLLDGFDMVVAPVSIPTLAGDWQLAPSAFSTALAAAVLGTGIGAAFIAPLGDRFGRRPLVIGSFAMVALCTLATPLIHSVNQLTALRFATGLGLGASLANAIALASEYAAPHLRSRIVACVYATSALGGAVGASIAPYLLGNWGWQGVYVFGGAAPLVLMPLLFAGLAESRRFLAERAGAGTAVAADSAGSMERLRALLQPPHRASTVLLWSLFFLSTFCTYMMSSWLPTLMHLSGWSMEDAVRSVMVFSFGGVIGGFIQGWMVDRGRILPAISLGFGITALSLAALNIAPLHTGLWLFLITVMGAGNMGVAYALTSFAAIVYPTGLRASGIGAAGACGRFGATLAPLIGGWLLAQQLAALQILTGLIIPMAAALLLVLVFAGRFRAAATH
ncbi:MFS transporter [Haliea sp. E17]|uniref:MFS transporter n=1 Tax=Haliea sp. E17 TaxID=3401576 RepID=UPI003AADBB7E